MSSKSILYLIIYILGSFTVPLLLLLLETIGQRKAETMLIGLLVLPILGIIFLEPFSYLWKKFVSKKEVPKPFAKGFINGITENIMVYWIFSLVLLLLGILRDFLD